MSDLSQLWFFWVVSICCWSCALKNGHSTTWIYISLTCLPDHEITQATAQKNFAHIRLDLLFSGYLQWQIYLWCNTNCNLLQISEEGCKEDPTLSQWNWWSKGTEAGRYKGTAALLLWHRDQECHICATSGLSKKTLQRLKEGDRAGYKHFFFYSWPSLLLVCFFTEHSVPSLDFSSLFLLFILVDWLKLELTSNITHLADSDFWPAEQWNLNEGVRALTGKRNHDIYHR